MLGDGQIIREFGRERRPGLEGGARLGPAPEGPAGWGEGLPMALGLPAELFGLQD